MAVKTLVYKVGWARLLVLAALGLYTALLISSVHATAGAADTSGYMNHARVLASGHVQVSARTIPSLPTSQTPSYLYTPFGFKPVGDDPRVLVPTYPPGLSLLVIASSAVFGWEYGANIMIVSHAILGLLACYSLARLAGLSARFSLVATGLLALSPLYLMFTTYLMSDLPATVWTTIVLVCALTSEARPRVSILAGFAFSIAVLIRPNSFINILGVAMVFGLSWRRWVYFGLGGLPGFAFFCWHSFLAYGAITTGYGSAETLFHSYLFGKTILHIAYWLPLLFTPVIVLFPGVIFLLRGNFAVRVMVVVVSAYIVFYSFYEYTHADWWYLRFILPVAPLLVVGSTLVLREVLDPVVSRKAWGAATLNVATVICLVAVVLVNWRESRRLHAMSVGKAELKYKQANVWLLEHIPHDSVVVGTELTGALYYHTPFTLVRSEYINPELAPLLCEAVRSEHRPLIAALASWEVSLVLEQRLPGTWTKLGAVQDLTFWKLEQ